MQNRPRVILDTNILLVSISSKSKTHWIFKALLKEKFELVISNEILTEYEEIISNKYSKRVAEDIIRVLLLLPNICKVDVYYNWNLLHVDETDNKFVDCAVASNSDYIVTADKHFLMLESIGFPYLNIINIDEFKKILRFIK